MCAVAAASGGGQRPSLALTSRRWGPWTERPLPEVVRVAHPPTAPPPVKVTGGVLVNLDGMTLCTYDRDAAGSGKSNCNGQCAFVWPPLQAGDYAKPSGDYNIIRREGGERPHGEDKALRQ